MLMKMMIGRSEVIHSMISWMMLFACPTNCTITGIFLLRISMARPNATARKMIWSEFPSTNGEMRLEGTIFRIMENIAVNSPPLTALPLAAYSKNGIQTRAQMTSVK